MYVYTKNGVQNTHLWAFTALLLWTGWNFPDFDVPKTSADKRRLITIIRKDSLCEALLLRYVTTYTYSRSPIIRTLTIVARSLSRPNYPQCKPLRCKSSDNFADMQNYLRFNNLRCTIYKKEQNTKNKPYSPSCPWECKACFGLCFRYRATRPTIVIHEHVIIHIINHLRVW